MAVFTVECITVVITVVVDEISTVVLTCLAMLLWYIVHGRIS